MSNTNRQKTPTRSGVQQMAIPTQILDDLSTRFVINIPKEEREDLIRVCFQLELAHWHYLDFICKTEPLLPRHNFTKFCVIIFRHIPFLTKFLPDLDSIIAKWKEYKQRVPTCGAILLDETLNNVLLVQGFGAKSWGFPKGKINENEEFVTCAAREVKEETGYDCTPLINDQCFLEKSIFEANIRLYIVRDVDKDFAFKPLARNEIKEIKWFDVSKLPVRKEDSSCGQTVVNANQFFTVCPFVKPLRKWISRERQLERQRIREEKFDGNQSDRFWAKSWDNIKFDWDTIWRDITTELQLKN